MIRNEHETDEHRGFSTSKFLSIRSTKQTAYHISKTFCVNEGIFQWKPKLSTLLSAWNTVAKWAKHMWYFATRVPVAISGIVFQLRNREQVASRRKICKIFGKLKIYAIKEEIQNFNKIPYPEHLCTCDVWLSQDLKGIAGHIIRYICQMSSVIKSLTL